MDKEFGWDVMAVHKWLGIVMLIGQEINYRVLYIHWRESSYLEE